MGHCPGQRAPRPQLGRLAAKKVTASWIESQGCRCYNIFATLLSMWPWGLGPPIQQTAHLLRPCCTRVLGLLFLQPLDPVGVAAPSPPCVPGFHASFRVMQPPPQSNPCARYCARFLIPVRFTDRNRPQRRCHFLEPAPPVSHRAWKCPGPPAFPPHSVGGGVQMPYARVQPGPWAPHQGGGRQGRESREPSRDPAGSGLGREGFRIWFC